MILSISTLWVSSKGFIWKIKAIMMLMLFRNRERKANNNLAADQVEQRKARSL